MGTACRPGPSCVVRGQFPRLAGLNLSSQVNLFSEAKWILNCGLWSCGRALVTVTRLCFRADGRQQAAVLLFDGVPHSPFPIPPQLDVEASESGVASALKRRRLGFRSFRPAVLQPPDSRCSYRPSRSLPTSNSFLFGDLLYMVALLVKQQPICVPRLSSSFPSPIPSLQTPHRNGLDRDTPANITHHRVKNAYARRGGHIDGIFC